MLNLHSCVNVQQLKWFPIRLIARVEKQDVLNHFAKLNKFSVLIFNNTYEVAILHFNTQCT